MNKMPVAQFIETKATQENGDIPRVSIVAEVLIPKLGEIENINNAKIRTAIEYAVAQFVKIKEKKIEEKAGAK